MLKLVLVLFLAFVKRMDRSGRGATQKKSKKKWTVQRYRGARRRNEGRGTRSRGKERSGGPEINRDIPLTEALDSLGCRNRNLISAKIRPGLAGILPFTHPPGKNRIRLATGKAGGIMIGPPVGGSLRIDHR